MVDLHFRQFSVGVGAQIVQHKETGEPIPEFDFTFCEMMRDGQLSEETRHYFVEAEIARKMANDVLSALDAVPQNSGLVVASTDISSLDLPGNVRNFRPK